MPDCSEITGLSLALFGAAFALATLLTLLLIKLSHRFRIYDYPGGRKNHREPMPFLGGVGVFVVFWVLFLSASRICGEDNFGGSDFITGFFLSSLVIFISGLIDDLIDLKFYYKLLAQVIAASILIAFGFEVVRLYFPFWRAFDLGWASYPVTVIWVVLLTNGINLIDGMDGLAGIVSLSVCIGLLIVAAFLGIAVVSIIAILLAGSILGFLLFNRPPAKIFLGDSGALFIGFVFSVVAIVCPIKTFTTVSMFVPLVAVSLPLLEIATTVIRRIWSGRQIYQPDNRHIFHYMMNFGYSEKAVLVFLGLISLLFNAFIPALFWFDRRKVFSIFILFLLLLFGIFFILKLSKDAKKL